MTFSSMEMEDLGQYHGLASGIYYIPTHPAFSSNTTFGLTDFSSDVEPVTFISLLSLNWNCFEKSIRNQLDQFRLDDDVFSDDFLDRIWVQSPGIPTANTMDKQLDYIIYKDKTIPLSFLDPKSDNTPPSGPYFKVNTEFYEAWKFFEDTQDAFVMALVSSNKMTKSYRELQFPSTGTHKRVAVPSRCYTLSRPKLLSGLRFAVKDTLDVTGCRTTAGSNDFGNLHGQRLKTAKVITELVELGAVLVGKTKTAQFGDGDTLTADWVETSCPWNPRADGFLIPSGSSAGSAAAIAAYKWLDFTIGTDTLGSIRGPASWQGIFGIRPTWDIISTDGVVPVSKYMDCVGFLSRSLDICFKLCTYYLPPLRKQPNLKFKLLYLNEHWDTEFRDIKACQEQFIAAIEQVTQTSRTSASVQEMWRSHDSGQQHVDFYAFSNTVARDIKLGSQHQFLQEYISDFRSKNGRYPYLNPVIRAIRQMASEISRDLWKTQEAEEKRKALSNWVQARVFNSGEDSEIVLGIAPMSDGRLTYRDEYHSEPIGISQEGWHPKLLSSLGGIPEIIVPIGEHKFTSCITGTEVYLPVTASVLIPKKQETIALTVIKEALEIIGLPQLIKTGRRCYENI